MQDLSKSSQGRAVLALLLHKALLQAQYLNLLRIKFQLVFSCSIANIWESHDKIM